MTKVREIFESDLLPHIWIYNRYKGKNGDVAVTEGRTKSYNGFQGHVAGNQSFARDYYYSYNTVVAKRYDLGEKGILYLVTSHDYGPTTKGQLWSLRRAIPDEINGRKVSKVEFDTTGRFPNGVDERYKAEWVSVVDFLLAQASEVLEKALKARENRARIVARGLEDVAQAEKLNSLLILERGGAVDRVRLDLERVPAYAPKPSNPNQRKYLRDWNEALTYLPNLPMIAAKAFRDDNLDLVSNLNGLDLDNKVITKVLDNEVGYKLTLKLKLSDCPWANIKVVGDRVLTSLGVRLGRDEVTKIYEVMLEVCHKQADEINAGGYWARFNKWGRHDKRNRNRNTISVGCHYFDSSTLASGYKYILDSLGTSEE